MNTIMASMENFFAYTPMQYFSVAHVLTLGFAVMLAAFVYFVMTVKQVAPQYRVMSALSGVVMVSAFMILYFQADSWQSTFLFNEMTGMFERVDGAQFTNGYRYLNRLIDVPMLLIQILFVLVLSSSKRFALGAKFVIAGALMIILGYIGQFYEIVDPKQLILRGIASTVFFIIILVTMYSIIFQGMKTKEMPAKAKKVLKAIRILFVVTWLLYPIAYAMPLFYNEAGGVVLRQILYTIADIGAKVIYGIILLKVAVIRSEAEKYKYM